jgi:ammonium transporter Rh
MCIQWALLCIGLFHKVYYWRDSWFKIRLSINSFIDADFSAVAFLISFGGVIGKTTPLQLFYMAFVEMIAFAVNMFVVQWHLGAVDAGGSMIIHEFGAYFGLAASVFLSRRGFGEHKENTSRYTSDILSMIGTVFLFIYWPSFNAALTEERRQRAVINTFLALTGSVLATFTCSYMFRGEKKYNMVDIQNATLAGGVAMGTSADLCIGPGIAILVGVLAGCLSTFGFCFIAPVLKRWNIHDTCGIHNLHGMPGIFGGLVGAITAHQAKPVDYFGRYNTIFTRDPNQGGYQVAGVIITWGEAAAAVFFPLSLSLSLHRIC